MPPPALYAARHQKLIGIMTGTTPDCGPHPGGTSPALGWSVLVVKQSGREGDWENVMMGRLLMKICQMEVKMSFFDIMSEVQKDQETFLQERFFF
jgi:hypothetical protein